jgi:hypothetical protein
MSKSTFRSSPVYYELQLQDKFEYFQFSLGRCSLHRWFKPINFTICLAKREHLLNRKIYKTNFHYSALELSWRFPLTTVTENVSNILTSLDIPQFFVFCDLDLLQFCFTSEWYSCDASLRLPVIRSVPLNAFVDVRDSIESFPHGQSYACKRDSTRA